MSWLPILLLGAIAFVLAAFVLRLPRAGWSILGAALMLGLAGYALQGHPGYAGAPKAAPDTMAQTGAAMVDARRQMFDPDQPAGEWITVADGFARNGDYEQAAGFLRAVIQKNPRDGEAWLALGNALGSCMLNLFFLVVVDSKALARQVLDAFEEFDYVVAPSGSCSGMIKEHYPA